MRVSSGVTIKVFVIIILSFVMNTDISYGNDRRCGPFNIFEGNDYCIQCRLEKGRKHYLCPGGDLGLTLLMAENSQCTVSYYSSQCEKLFSDKSSGNEFQAASSSTQSQSDLMTADQLEAEKDKIPVTFTREQFHTLIEYLNDSEAISIFENTDPTMK